MEELTNYNERLFNKSTLRGKLHYARFYWLQEKVNQYTPKAESVLELGCFDGKTIYFLPDSIKEYHGYDANWEEGLDLAQEEFENDKRLHFFQSENLDQFRPDKEMYSAVISMETLEHLPLIDLENYICKMHEHTSRYCYVSLPNEKGIVHLFKYLIKKYIARSLHEPYSLTDIINGFLGRFDKIERIEGTHKGFDQEHLISLLRKYFNVREIKSIPFRFIPIVFSFTIGLVLEKKIK